MRNPIQELQAEELEKEEICRDILNSTRNELYLGMRFLDSALSALRPEPDTGVFVAGTDGELLRFSPDQLMKWYEKGRVEVKQAVSAHDFPLPVRAPVESKKPGQRAVELSL